MTDRFHVKLWDKIKNKFLFAPIDVLHSLAEAYPGRYERLQCTGLKDSEGVLIFQGDILEVTDAGLGELVSKELLVEWNDKAAGFTFEELEAEPDSFDYMAEVCPCTKIVGNVYETRSKGLKLVEEESK